MANQIAAIQSWTVGRSEHGTMAPVDFSFWLNFRSANSLSRT